MATLLGQLLLLVLCVTLVVAVEHKEFGCKFDDEHYNFVYSWEEFGDYVERMWFDDINQFKLFMNDLEKVRKMIRYNSLYNTMDPFFQMHKKYKAAKASNPGYKFSDFFPKYKPNPYMNKQRFNQSTIFSVIDIYRMMNKSFGNKYPTFKDSFVLATCDEDIKTVVLDNVSSGMEQRHARWETPRGFVHDRIVGVIPFLIVKDAEFLNVRGFVIVESVHLTASQTLAPIVMAEEYLNHKLSKNEVQLFGPNVARYNWVPGTSESYIRIDYVEYDTNVTRWATGTRDLVGKERVTQTDLLFMTPRSLCSFVKQTWKNNLLDTSIRLLQDSIKTGTPTRYYMSFELKPVSESDSMVSQWDWFCTFLFRRTREVNGNSQTPEYTLLPEGLNTSLKPIPLEEVFKNETIQDTLKTFATVSDIEYSQLLDMIRQLDDIYQNDTNFINEFNSYKPPEVDTATFWSDIDLSDVLRRAREEYPIDVYKHMLLGTKPN